jgi:hypothetical protein
VPETLREQPKFAHVTVARGRTIYVPDPRRKTFQGRKGDTGEEIFTPALVPFTEGQELDIPAEEVPHLRQAGYLVDPNAPALPLGNGPSYGREVEIIRR